MKDQVTRRKFLKIAASAGLCPPRSGGGGLRGIFDAVMGRDGKDNPVVDASFGLTLVK